MRLQSFLSQSGVASRRGVVNALDEGLVKVNGEVVRIPSYPIFPDKDEVTYQGERVKPPSKRLYYLFHKPKDVITTARDTHGRKTVLEFFKDVPGRLYPVGRLDRDTTGVLLVSNDGALTNQLTHPRFGVQKVYEAVLDKQVSEAETRKLEEGVVIEGEKTAPCKVKILSGAEGRQKVEIVLHEGRKRQIRLMCESIGFRVVELHRKRFGPLTLQGLRPGEKRPLLDSEIEALKESTQRGGSGGQGGGDRGPRQSRFHRRGRGPRRGPRRGGRGRGRRGGGGYRGSSGQGSGGGSQRGGSGQGSGQHGSGGGSQRGGSGHGGRHHRR